MLVQELSNYNSFGEAITQEIVLGDSFVTLTVLRYCLIFYFAVVREVLVDDSDSPEYFIKGKHQLNISENS